jgi:gluconokinase
MGPAGSGKTVVMAALAARLGWPTLEGDDLHSAANVARMAAGVALSDADRRPWLAAIAAWIRVSADAGEPSIVTCSALRRRYRETLRAAAPRVTFVQLETPVDVLAARLAGRTGHFMPPELLASQLEALEPLDDEPGFRVDATRPPEDVASEIIDRLGPLLASARGND